MPVTLLHSTQRLDMIRGEVVIGVITISKIRYGMLPMVVVGQSIHIIADSNQ